MLPVEGPELVQVIFSRPCSSEYCSIRIWPIGRGERVVRIRQPFEFVPRAIRAGRRYRGEANNNSDYRSCARNQLARHARILLPNSWSLDCAGGHKVQRHRSSAAATDGQCGVAFDMKRRIAAARRRPDLAECQRESRSNINDICRFPERLDRRSTSDLVKVDADGRDRPAVAMVVGGAARRPQAVPDGAERDHQGGAGLVRRAGLCRGRDRNSAGLAGQ